MSFPKEVKDKESLNSCAVVEIGLDEIPPTSCFESQMCQLKDVELPNSRVVFKVSLDEIPSTLGANSALPCSLAKKVNPFHVIFYLNKILIATCFDKGSHTVIFHLRLKEFLKKCLA